MQRFVRIPPVGLEGDLVVPSNATGIVVFAHGSGSSRHSPRNRFVAEALQEAGLATLLFDLLTAEEEKNEARGARLRFNIEFLAGRINQATECLSSQPESGDLRIGYFGASTGGGAALVAAAQRPDHVFAVVSRGGRPDLAGDWLRSVQTPTLLLVGAKDDIVIELNRAAFDRIPIEDKRMEIIPGATHLFEEPGTLEQVTALATNWFQTHLRSGAWPGEHPRSAS